MKMQTVSVNFLEEDGYPDFRKLIKQSHEKSCENLEFDIREYSDSGLPTKSTYFDKGLYIYPLRYIKGDKLFGSQPGYYQSMSSPNGIQDVYVFNKRYNEKVGSDAERKVYKAADAEKLTYGFFLPGTVIREVETGKVWICYCGWFADGKDFNVGQHKARFINFDSPVETEEKYYIRGVPKTGIFSNELIPEDEVPMAMASILKLTEKGRGEDDNVFVKSCKEFQKVNPKDFIFEYDTITPGKTKTKDHLKSFSMAYIPRDGRNSGTQPYMRMVYDGSNNSWRSDATDKYYQYLHYFFYKHYNDDLHKNELLDLTHLYDGGLWVSDDPIMADRWSRCELSDTKQRNADFTRFSAYPSSYRYDYYTYRDNEWFFNTGTPSKPKYTDAYFAPVVIANYMEIDDKTPVNRFTGFYNGKKFELLYYPEQGEIYSVMVLPADLQSSLNGHSYMDEQAFDPIK